MNNRILIVFAILVLVVMIIGLFFRSESSDMIWMGYIAGFCTAGFLGWPTVGKILQKKNKEKEQSHHD